MHLIIEDEYKYNEVKYHDRNYAEIFIIVHSFNNTVDYMLLVDIRLFCHTIKYNIKDLSISLILCAGNVVYV